MIKKLTNEDIETCKRISEVAKLDKNESLILMFAEKQNEIISAINPPEEKECKCDCKHIGAMCGKCQFTCRKTKPEGWEERLFKRYRQIIGYKTCLDFKDFIRTELNQQREEIVKIIKETKRDVISQFCYQGAPSKAEVQRQNLISNGYNQAKREIIEKLK